MFIRRTQTSAKNSSEAYFSHRLVEAVRVGKKVHQRTILNLGSQLELPQPEWPALALRIEEILHGQASLLPPESTVEKLAQRFAAQLIAHGADMNAKTRFGCTPLRGAYDYHQAAMAQVLLRHRTTQ